MNQLKVVGFTASDNKKLAITVQLPSGANKTYQTDTERVEKEGCSVDFVLQPECSGQLALAVFRSHRIRSDKLLASAGIPMVELRLSGDAGTSIVHSLPFSLIIRSEIRKEMVIHLKKPYFHNLNVFIKTYRLTSASPLIGSTATASLIQSSDTLSAPSEHSTSAPAVKNDLATEISELKPKVDEKRTGVERNKKYVELGDALLQKLETLSEASS
ncbi:hypothetical protein VNI00_019266 [Paramarasmius palmivorus]|uniref:Uncharacterized protein n=1 Tax=Paramarasmius palmivorus TaxID=297713 RepID=A0AAW0APE7_9AGAR